MNLTVEDCNNQKTWDAFITSDPTSNFLQSFDFYEFHSSRGKKIVRRLFKDGDKPVAAYAGVIETAKRGKYLAIAGGPILDWKNKPLVKKVFADIKSLGEENRCVFVRVRPSSNCPKTP